MKSKIIGLEVTGEDRFTTENMEYATGIEIGKAGEGFVKIIFIGETTNLVAIIDPLSAIGLSESLIQATFFATGKAPKEVH